MIFTHRENKARKRKTYTATLPLLCHDECVVGTWIENAFKTMC